MDAQRAIEILKENSENPNVRPAVREALRMAVDAMRVRPIASAPRDGSEVLVVLNGTWRTATFTRMAGSPATGKKWPLYADSAGFEFAPEAWVLAPESHITGRDEV